MGEIGGDNSKKRSTTGGSGKSEQEKDKHRVLDPARPVGGRCGGLGKKKGR